MAKRSFRDACHIPRVTDRVHGEVKVLAKKIMMGLVLLAIAMTAATTGAFANAPGSAYIQCGAGYSSPVRCTPDSWEPAGRP